MNSPDKKKGNLKKKIFHEMVVYWFNVCYLTLVFGVFAWYRRFLLASYDIMYTNYGIAMIEALVLAKVIMIGEVIRLGRGLEQKPLIYSTLYKTVTFTFFVGVFKIIEQVIKGLWKGEGLTGGLIEFFEKGSLEMLANSLVVFVAFIPFFGVKELGRVLGEDKIQALFFRRRDDQGFESWSGDV